MKIFTVSFFGYRQINKSFVIEERLKKKIQELLLTKEYLEFLVDHNGEFDQLVASTVHRCKRAIRDDNSTLILVLLYATAEYINNADSFHEYYDEVEICAVSSEKYFKVAHQIRNCSIVDRFDLAIFCAEHCSGGTYQTIKYVAKNGAKFINLSAQNE